MRKSIVKLLCLCLALSFVFTSLVGCGEGEYEYSSYYVEVPSNDSDKTQNNKDNNKVNSNESKNEISTNDNKEISLKDLEGTTVDVLWWQAPTADDKKLFANFEKKYKIKVKVTQTTKSDYSSKVASMVVAKEGLDVALVDSFPFNAIQCFVPVSEMGINLSDKFWDQDVIKSYSIGGKAYGVTSAEGIWFNSSYALFYNADLFDENGITSPRELWESGNWNWDTFYETAQKVSKISDDIVAYAPNNSYAFMYSAGTDYVTYDGKAFKSNLSSPDVLKAWQMNSKFLSSKVMGTNADGQAALGTGEVAMVCLSTWATRKDSVFSNANCTVDCVPFPSPKGSKQFVEYAPQVWGLPKTADNAKAAGLFLKYILDPANYPRSVDEIIINPEMKDTLEFFASGKAQRIMSVSKDVIGYTSKSQNAGALTYTLVRTAEGQISSILEEYKSSTNSSVAAANDLIAE